MNGVLKLKSTTDILIESIRKEEKEKLIKEGYIHKSNCPKARQDRKIKELKKAIKVFKEK